MEKVELAKYEPPLDHSDSSDILPLLLIECRQPMKSTEARASE